VRPDLAKIRETISQKHLGIVAHACCPSYWGGRDRRKKGCSPRVVKVKSYLKNKPKTKDGNMAQVLECQTH
jgi:hypothetical protein